MKFTKKRLTRGLALGMVAAVSIATFAVFTDRYESSATAKAGSLDLQLEQLLFTAVCIALESVLLLFLPERNFMIV